MITLIHELPGRIRFRVKALKKKSVAMHGYAEHLKQMEGIVEAEGNPVLGSILVFYDPKKTGKEAIFASFQSFLESAPSILFVPEKREAPSLFGQRMIKRIISVVIGDLLFSALKILV